MEPQKFIQSYKCDCFEPHNYCNCPQKIIASYNMIDNLNDVADAIVKIINICGIHLAKTKAFADIIRYHFLHFEEIRHRIDCIPRKRLSKEDLIHDLSCKCCMSRLDAQISYSILKRAFKAFYYGTDEGGVPNYLLNEKLAHSSECLWVYAAKRAAEICAKYRGMFFACQKDLECKIKLIFKQLCDHLKKRTQTDGEYECTCLKCFKRITRESLKSVKVTTQMHGHGDSYEALYAQEQDENKIVTDEFENQEKTSCSCPPLNITQKDYAFQAVAESVNTDCSQGPFICHWNVISKEEFEVDDAKPDIKLPEEFSCSPCYYLDEDCDPESECACEDCTCESDDIFCGEFDEEAEHAMVKEDKFLSEEETLLTFNTENMTDEEFRNKYAGCRKPFIPDKSKTSFTTDSRSCSHERTNSKILSKL